MKTHFLAGIMTISLALSSIARAEEQFPVLKVGSEVYSNVTVTTVTATDIYFQHAKGMGNAKLKNLDRELQKKFKYDPVKAEQIEKNRRQSNAEFRTELTKATAAKPGAKPAPPPKPLTTDNQPDIVDSSINAKSFRGQSPPILYVENWVTEMPDRTGKFVLIDFWATWCGPCRASIPLLNAIHKNYGDKIVVIGLTDESVAEVQRMTSPKINYYVASDTQKRTSRAAAVRAIPHAMLIDPQGIVRYEGHPELLNSKNALANLLSRYGQE
jgi:cytochrome c biogenesis protein CcmG, thiol:disulfide interchange protein DsbE